MPLRDALRFFSLFSRVYDFDVYDYFAFATMLPPPRLFRRCHFSLFFCARYATSCRAMLRRLRGAAAASLLLRLIIFAACLLLCRRHAHISPFAFMIIFIA